MGNEHGNKGLLLYQVNSPEDIKKLNLEQLKLYAKETREFLIENVSKTGGHLASNLGVVELTLALHRVFSTPEDKIVWDVGHQAYVHKIITGRRDQFHTLRKMHGISGFPKVKESPHDCFNTGHSSTSISAALGLAKARDIKKEQHSVIAVIGDGALTGGMSFEALNDAGRSPNNFIVILNDNEMSISENVGGLSCYLSKIRTEPIYFKVKEDLDIILNKIPAIGKSAVKALSRVKGTIKYAIMPGVIFEELGFKYLGPIDGHDMNELCHVLSRAKNTKGPVFIHICTQKGKGYSFAEQKPHQFHSVSPFEIETGETKPSSGQTYSDVLGSELSRLAQKDEKIVAITAAMPHGTGLDSFSKKYPDRFFDVGIAEQHAVTFAAGLAKDGLTPVIAVYSSFLQRAYDQIVHDVAIQNLHVVFGVDRAGIVGEDGETHQGIYDISYLSHIPNMTIMAPSDYLEFKNMLHYAVSRHCGPIAIRYPRGKGADVLSGDVPASIHLGRGVTMRTGHGITIAAEGPMVGTALQAAELLEQNGVSCEVLNLRFIKPLDEKLILGSAAKTQRLVTLEDNTLTGGMGSMILSLVNQSGLEVKVKNYGYPDQFIVHGSRNELMELYRMDAASIAKDIMKWLNKINRNQP